MALGSTSGGPFVRADVGGELETETQRDPAVAPMASGRPARSVVGAWRRDIRVFSSASDAPRSRRPADVVLFAHGRKRLLVEYAIQFIALAVPSSAARLALDVRFFGRNGIDGGGALSIGVIASVCGFITQVLLILVISLSGLASLDLGGAAPPRRPRPAARPVEDAARPDCLSDVGAGARRLTGAGAP